ncbi:hypothetical protein PUN28_019703 [Cardiocondyla obscurior]|uniref:Uncharacterized protein n=1 Tax=Cardiocondyla obscurior TaxID=286306 RepID=A0AAW2EE12_9HYME
MSSSSEEDFPPCTVGPLSLNVDDRDDLIITSDVDSILVSCRSIAAFKCHVQTKINAYVYAISECKNKKLTVYYARRDTFSHRREPPVFFRDEEVSSTEKFYETIVATIDDNSIYVLFQIDRRSTFFREIDDETEKSMARRCVEKIILKLLIQPSRRLFEDSKTVEGGINLVQYNVNKSFPVCQQDYAAYSSAVENETARLDKRRVFGVSFLRFYSCKHGIRVDPSTARRYLNRLVDVDHPHVDVVQVHAGNTLRLSSAISRHSVKLSPKLNTYTFGFLAYFGHFDVHARPCQDTTVTFMQGYSAAAKIAHAPSSGTLAMFALLNGLRDRKNIFKSMYQTCMQHLINVTSYTQMNVDAYKLRLEDVVTIDWLNAEDSMSAYIRRIDVFSETRKIATLIYTDQLNIHYARAVKHIWYGMQAIVPNIDKSEEERKVECVKFILAMYDTCKKNFIDDNGD